MAQPSIAKRIVAPDIGEWLLSKTQRLRRVDRGCRRRFAVDQAVQDIEDMSLGGKGLSGFPCVGGRLNITPPWL
jgi:hypothetical protein